jgi:hypothetical protein
MNDNRARGSLSDDTLLRHWNDGLTYTAIGALVGITKERVRQRLRRHGISGVNVNPRPLMFDPKAAALNCVSVAEMARIYGVRDRDVLGHLERHGLQEEVGVLLSLTAARRKQERLQARRARAIARIRSVAARLGRTPTTTELALEGVFASQLHTLFGGTGRAMIHAGLTPNATGAPPSELPPWFRLEQDSDERED